MEPFQFCEISLGLLPLRKDDTQNREAFNIFFLASCLCTIFTAILKQRIEANVENRDVLRKEQSWFKKHGLYWSNFYSIIVDKHTSNILKKLYPNFIDYEKAFDCVEHRLLQ